MFISVCVFFFVFLNSVYLKPECKCGVFFVCLFKTPGVDLFLKLKYMRPREHPRLAVGAEVHEGDTALFILDSVCFSL